MCPEIVNKVYLKLFSLIYFTKLSFNWHLFSVHIFLKNDHGLKELQDANNIPHLDLFLQMDTNVSKNSY